MKHISLLLVMSVVLLITACSEKEENSSKKEKFPVTNPIVIDTFYTIDYVADIHSLKNVELRARVKGYLEAIQVDEGQSVKEGQLLFIISSQEYKEDLLKAKAQLKSAIAEAKSAELDLQNVQTLVEKNVVSKTEAEMSQSQLDALSAKVDEARSYEASVQLRLSLTEIKAPFDGIIDRIPYKAGSLIDEGTLLTAISNNKEVFAYFNVSEKDYLEYAISKEQGKSKEVSLILANGALYSHSGIIETTESEFNKSTGNIAFRARFPNPEQILKHGSSGKVLVKTDLKNAMLIPQKSTFEIQENLYVYVVDNDNTVQIRKIIPSVRLPHLFAVSSGLSSQDKIIYEGIQRVKEGDKIIPEQVHLSQIKNN